MNSPSEPLKSDLIAGEGVSFLIRWRGTQQGPYSMRLIEKKLAANEIGLLHEILHNAKWITIRDFLAKREASLRAQRQAQEEHDLRAKDEQQRREQEESARAAREQEERLQLQAKILVEERRKRDFPPREEESGVRCPMCNSTQIAGHKQGFDVGRAVVGDLLLGPLGLLGGMIGKDRVKITCLKCGHVFEPGQSR
jgi:hypothetical protein